MKSTAVGIVVGLMLSGYIVGTGVVVASQTQQAESLHALTYYYDPLTGCYYVSNDGSSQAGITPRMEYVAELGAIRPMCRPPKH